MVNKMDTKTITIKSVEKTSGKKKDNTEWHRISIKATDGKFYSTFSQIPSDALTEGAELKVLVSQSQLSNTYDIKKVISYTNPQRSQSQSGEISESVPPAFEDADIYARELMNRALKMAHEKTPEWKNMSEYPYLIATLIQTMHAKISGDRIAQQEAEKLKAYGGKKW
jgi:hypothetical protein